MQCAKLADKGAFAKEEMLILLTFFKLKFEDFLKIATKTIFKYCFSAF